MIGSCINATPKGTSLQGNTSYDVYIVKIGPLVRPVCTKKPKNTENPNSGKLGIRPDYPRRRIEMQFCMVGDIQLLVLSFKLIKIGSAVIEI